MDNYQKLFNESSFIATGRDKRPFINKESTKCPFCLINQEELKSIIDEKWINGKLIYKIIPNRYPVTCEQGEHGIHDVVIDTEVHELHPKDFSEDHWYELLIGLHKRWQHLMQLPNINFIQVFKNYGHKAGASISHSHWQIIALEHLPISVCQKYEPMVQGNLGHCYLCSDLHRKEGFLIDEDETYEIWVPPIPMYAYEVWIIPKQHHQHYGELSLDEIRKLGVHIRSILNAYNELRPNYAFNICFIGGDIRNNYPYHFHIRIVMRIGQLAGFEIATGCHIVTTEPSQYANEIKTFIRGT